MSSIHFDSSNYNHLVRRITVMLSARVPDCLVGCHEDGLDIEQWIKEDLVDCITMGSRSFDIKIEEIKSLSS